MTGIGSDANSDADPTTTALLDSMANQNGTVTGGTYYNSDEFGGKEWLALFFMTFGWVLLFTSIVGFWRVKRWETSIRAASRPQAPVTASDLAREVEVRRNIESIFGVGDDRELEASLDPQAEAEIRLARHLRAAGLM